MDQDLMRIGVSLPENLLEKFDEIIEKRGYSSRSEGIRDAIRNYIVRHEWMSDIKGRRVGTLTLMYDHTKRGLSNTLTEIQHEHADIIQSSVHIHLDHENCLEVIILDGDGANFKDFGEKVMALKGVKYSKLNTAKPSEDV